MSNETINLKNKEGQVVTVPKTACYKPDSDGRIMAAIGGFSYFWGIPTEEPATHQPIDHPSLWRRGELEPIPK